MAVKGHRIQFCEIAFFNHSMYPTPFLITIDDHIPWGKNPRKDPIVPVSLLNSGWTSLHPFPFHHGCTQYRPFRKIEGPVWYTSLKYFIIIYIIYLLLVECRESSINQWRKDIVVMRVKQCHKPSMTGNGNHTTEKKTKTLWWLGDGRSGMCLPALMNIISSYNDYLSLDNDYNL